MPSVLWGVLLIALFSLGGLALLIAPSLFGGVPERYRPVAVACYQGVLFTGVSASSYFSARRSHERWMPGLWLALTLLTGLFSLIRIRQALKRPDDDSAAGGR